MLTVDFRAEIGVDSVQSLWSIAAAVAKPEISSRVYLVWTVPRSLGTRYERMVIGRAL